MSKTAVIGMTKILHNRKHAGSDESIEHSLLMLDVASRPTRVCCRPSDEM
jgi:hypothetical protein